MLSRNLRDGELTLVDGAGTSLTVVLDDGDLSWTETLATLEVLDRGSLAGGHTRPGDDVPVDLSFTAKWTQLIREIPTGGGTPGPFGLYEFLTVSGDVESTSGEGEQATITLHFTVVDPAGGATERVTFDRVYRQTLTMSEGEDANRIAFAGRSFRPRPTIERLAVS